MTSPGPSSGGTAALQDEAACLPVSLRVGIHTAEVERLGDDVAGVGVHVGARVAAAATRVRSG